MSSKLIQNGEVLNTVSTGGVVTEGMLIRRGARCGVALNTTTGAGGALRLHVGGGVWRVAKIAGASGGLTPGAKVYGRSTGSVGQIKVTGVATGVIIGTAWETAVTGATTAVVQIHPHAI